MQWSVFGRILAAFVLCASLPALAQKFPAKPVRVVVSTNAGGLQDQLARGVAQGLQPMWGEAVVIEARPGIGAIAAADTVLKAPADGYTIFATDNITLLTNSVLRADKMPYDIEKQFVPVVGLVSSSNMIVANPSVPANSLPDLVALLKSKPGDLNFGSYGLGSVSHINMQALLTQFGLKATHIPYTGGQPLAAALMAGNVQFGFNGMTSSISQIKSGRLRAIAYGGLKRSALFPDVPTIAETVPGFDSTTWFAWYMRAGTPQPILDKVIADIQKVITQPAFVDKFVSPVGNELMNVAGQALAERFSADKKVFAQRVKPLDLKLDY